jgi:hypothetical protein
MDWLTCFCVHPSTIHLKGGAEIFCVHPASKKMAMGCMLKEYWMSLEIVDICWWLYQGSGTGGGVMVVFRESFAKNGILVRSLPTISMHGTGQFVLL